MTSAIVSTPLTDVEFATLSSALLAHVEAMIDQWLQDDLIDIDASRSGGMLQLKLPNGSQLVLNTQPPLHEMWLAARSGGFHYKHVNGKWLDTRDRSELLETLSRCVSEQAGQPLRFPPPA